jgi:hypothetical protein
MSHQHRHSCLLPLAPPALPGWCPPSQVFTCQRRNVSAATNQTGRDDKIPLHMTLAWCSGRATPDTKSVVGGARQRNPGKEGTGWTEILCEQGQGRPTRPRPSRSISSSRRSKGPGEKHVKVWEKKTECVFCLCMCVCLCACETECPR